MVLDTCWNRDTRHSLEHSWQTPVRCQIVPPRYCRIQACESWNRNWHSSCSKSPKSPWPGHSDKLPLACISIPCQPAQQHHLRAFALLCLLWQHDIPYNAQETEQGLSPLTCAIQFSRSMLEPLTPRLPLLLRRKVNCFQRVIYPPSLYPPRKKRAQRDSLRLWHIKLQEQKFIL